MELTRIAIDKEKLFSLDESEITLFLGLGHLTNEINATTKLLYWSANATTDQEANEKGQLSLMFFLIRLLAGKLYEGWVLLSKHYFNSKLSKDYHKIINETASTAIKSLKKYFGPKNASKIIRNNFSYHYSPDEVSKYLRDFDGDLLAFLHEETAPNSLFDFAESTLLQALLNLLSENGIETSIKGLSNEFIDVSLWFSQASDGIMASIIDKNKGKLLVSEPEKIEVENLLKFDEIEIPWFADTDAFDFGNHD